MKNQRNRQTRGGGSIEAKRYQCNLTAEASLSSLALRANERGIVPMIGGHDLALSGRMPLGSTAHSRATRTGYTHDGFRHG